MKSNSSTQQKNSAKTPIPGWFLCFSIIVLAALGWFVAKHSGGFHSEVTQPWHSATQLAQAQPPQNTSLRSTGQGLYARLCSQCHQFDGMGDPSKAPPLVGAEWLTGAGPNRVARIMLDGFTGPITVKGHVYNLTMPAWRDALTDTQIAAVLNYTRNEWGNKAPDLTPEQIQAVRNTTKGRPTPWTTDELNRVPER